MRTQKEWRKWDIRFLLIVIAASMLAAIPTYYIAGLKTSAIIFFVVSAINFGLEIHSQRVIWRRK